MKNMTISTIKLLREVIVMEKARGEEKEMIVPMLHPVNFVKYQLMEVVGIT
jgi:hypothetical protein